MDWESWLWGWDFWLLVYTVPGFIFTEIAMRLAERYGAVTPETHTSTVRAFAYLFHFLFWPIFVITAFLRLFKRDE